MLKNASWSFNDGEWMKNMDLVNALGMYLVSQLPPGDPPPPPLSPLNHMPTLLTVGS